MVDLNLLTDAELKSKLLQYGVKAGPIVGTTRALYERKLHRVMIQCSKHGVNNEDDAERYSDSDEEEESGSEQLGTESVSRTDLSATPSTVGLNYQSKEFFYPQCFAPPLRQIENRLSPQSKAVQTERSCSQGPVENTAQWQLNKTPNASYLTPEWSPLPKQTITIKKANEPVTDVMMEMLPDTAVPPTGIMVTKRRPIKGAAGRPVRFKYPETPLSPATLERLEVQQRLVPLWVQIIVIVLMTAILYVIYISVEEPQENPFRALLNEAEQR